MGCECGYFTPVSPRRVFYPQSKLSFQQVIHSYPQKLTSYPHFYPKIDIIMPNHIISLPQILIGVGFAALISLAAWRLGALASSGAWAATVMGSVIFGLGGLQWAALLLTFFITSSALSKMFKQRKKEVNIKYAKGSRRDWGQVFANGGVGMFVIFLHLLTPQVLWPWLAFAGAFATANADTWATELGIFSPSKPRLITTWKPVPRGTSGGISLVGTLATTAGAALVGAVGWLFTSDLSWWKFIGAVTLAGLIGSLIDSLLGATVQAIYYDPIREKETEKVVYDQNGSPAAPVRGFDWMNNDMVNFTAALCGALAAVGFWHVLL
jgi:uncharacterized protein (TIGR00297 family)